MGEKISSYINKSLGNVSMYNGVLFGLISIWAVALLLSLTSVLSFNPLAMIASAAVLVVSVGLSSWLIGALFGVRAHGPSSIITGLILALIFTPTLEPTGLLILALVGLIAGASKYVLTLRGRHIFNPAALAAVAIGLTGLAAASWWVATPPLTLIVLAIVIISMYKTKNYAIILTFLGVAIPLLLVYLALNGVDFVSSLVLLLSWPLLFFAGIMLTEPLTLPPRKWHMYVEAVIVAILFVVPIKIGEFETNPAVALLVGNLFVAFVAGRRSLQLKFKERRTLTPTTDEFVFETNTPAAFKPGQFMELNVPQTKQDLRGERRSFSVTSLPGSKEVTFGIKFYEPSSTFKKALRSLKPDASIAVSNISGDFILPKDTDVKLLFIAVGIGVTPFISQLKTMIAEDEKRDITLVYSVSSAEELAYIDVLEKSGIRCIVVSPNKPVALPSSWEYYEASRVTKDIIEKSVPDIIERVGYVSGPPIFVQVTKKSLRNLGIRKVSSDYFVGY